MTMRAVVMIVVMVMMMVVVIVVRLAHLCFAPIAAVERDSQCS